MWFYIFYISKKGLNGYLSEVLNCDDDRLVQAVHLEDFQSYIISLQLKVGNFRIGTRPLNGTH